VLCLAGVAAWRLWPASAPDLTDVRAIGAALDARAVQLWHQTGLRRPDGCVYTVDVGHLATHAALRRDRTLYDALGPTLRGLVRDDPSDPYTRGFVPWRRCLDQPDDASGTTEALRVAEALWRGGAAFDLADDQARARVVLDGYARHATVDQRVWMVRNYFDFGTRAFANDSYLVDYDPDFVAEVAAETGDADLAELARRSARLIDDARAPSGLIHTLVQPDVATLMPDAPIPIFSPNDIIQLNNACTVAAVAAHTAPVAAGRVLAFAMRRRRDLRRAYFGLTGQPVDGTAADSTTWSCLVRLAARLGDDGAVAAFAGPAIHGWRWVLDDPTPRPYATTEALLAVDALERAASKIAAIDAAAGAAE